VNVARLNWETSAPAPLRALEALRARRGFEPGLLTMPLAAATLRRGAFDAVHAFTLPDGAVAARSGLPAVLTFPFVPTRESVAARRGRLALVQEVLAGCRIVAADEATADGLERWLGVTALALAEVDYEEVMR
jgi:hypothetical protein